MMCNLLESSVSIQNWLKGTAKLVSHSHPRTANVDELLLRTRRSRPRSVPTVASFGIYGVTMKQLSSMDFDELFALKQKVEAALASRVKKERERLTTSLQRLDALNLAEARGARAANGHGKSRTLAAKYRNPTNSKETWAGRGNKPRWLVAALKGGKKKLADFAV